MAFLTKTTEEMEQQVNSLNTISEIEGQKKRVAEIKGKISYQLVKKEIEIAIENAKEK